MLLGGVTAHADAHASVRALPPVPARCVQQHHLYESLWLLPLYALACCRGGYVAAAGREPRWRQCCAIVLAAAAAVSACGWHRSREPPFVAPCVQRCLCSRCRAPVDGRAAHRLMMFVCVVLFVCVRWQAVALVRKAQRTRAQLRVRPTIVPCHGVSSAVPTIANNNSGGRRLCWVSPGYSHARR